MEGNYRRRDERRAYPGWLRRGGWMAKVCLAALVADCPAVAAESLPAVVVTEERLRETESEAATLTPTPLVELPLSASHLTVDAFTERLPADIADLADYSPGVSRRSNYWGLNSPTFQLRGFNTGSSTAYYRDGFRYQSLGPMAMANVEGIEILRGPVGALYGWADPGGAVHVRTKQPSSTPLTEASLWANQWGRAGVSGDFGGPTGEASRYRLVVSHEEGGSFRDRQSLQQTLLAPSWSIDLGGSRNFSVALEWLDDRRTTDYGIPAVNGRPAQVPVERVYTEPWGRQHSQSTRFSARWSQPLADGRLSVAWSWYDFRYLEYHDAESASVSGATLRRWYETYPEHYRWTTAYLDWAREFATGPLAHRFLGRLETARETRSIVGGEFGNYAPIDVYAPVYGQNWTPGADFTRFDQCWEFRSLGLTLQDEIRVGAWTWLLGLRYADLEQTYDYTETQPNQLELHPRQSDTALMGRIGASWRLGAGWSLYGNFASGALPTLPQTRAWNGDPFVPVTGTQTEFGAKYEPAGGRWLATLAWFDISRQNVRTSDPDHPGYTITTGEQRSQGLEVAWQGRLPKGWRVTAQGTWMDAVVSRDNRYRVGNKLPYAPEWSASAWLSRHFAAADGGRWQVGGGAVHVGARYADFDNATRLPGYTRFDTGATYGPADWSITASVENLFDRIYYASGVENRPTVIYPGAPRTVSLRLTHRIR